MNPRTEALRRRSLDTPPSISAERALLLTRFYRENDGRWSVPVMRARSFLDLCEKKTIHLGEGELIVGERGPAPKAVPTFPELTCHSVEDLRILDSRPKTSYAVAPDVIEAYEREVIPYWRGRSLRDRLFATLPPEWHALYEAGLFTEFMEQRAPGHTVLDDKIYRRGLLDFKADIAAVLATLDYRKDPEAWAKREELLAMDIACDAVLLFAARHAEEARRAADAEADPARRAELRKIADACAWVPAHAPRDFHEALQSYWFCHLAVITELNGWDSFNPGHLDQHLRPFYERGLADGSLTRESARELLECFFVKFNNHPAPPKVGVTAAESGTYTDFANINLGGLLADGSDGSNELSHLLLDVIDEMHLLQPSSNLQLLAQDARRRAEARAARRPQGLRLPVALQRRRRGRGAAAAGQDARGRAGGRAAPAASRWGPSARRPTSSPATSTCRRCWSWPSTTASTRAPARGSARPRERRSPSPRSTPSSPPSRRRCATSST